MREINRWLRHAIPAHVVAYPVGMIPVVFAQILEQFEGFRGVFGFLYGMLEMYFTGRFFQFDGKFERKDSFQRRIFHFPSEYAFHRAVDINEGF